MPESEPTGAARRDKTFNLRMEVELYDAAMAKADGLCLGGSRHKASDQDADAGIGDRGKDAEDWMLKGAGERCQSFYAMP